MWVVWAYVIACWGVFFLVWLLINRAASAEVPRKFNGAASAINPIRVKLGAGALAFAGSLLLGPSSVFAWPLLFFLTWRLQRILMTAPGFKDPSPRLPRILVLRPFRSRRRDELFQTWVAPALWQLGQPVITNDSQSYYDRKLNAPRRPATKRLKFCFYQVLEPGDWVTHVALLVRRAAVVVMDTSVYRDALLAEMELVSKDEGSLRKLVVMHEEDIVVGDEEKRGRYFEQVSPAVREKLNDSIAYHPLDEKSLEALWETLVSRCASLLGVPVERVPDRRAPRRLIFRASTISAVIVRARATENVGSKPGRVTLRDAGQERWDAARDVLESVGVAQARMADQTELQRLTLLLTMKPPEEFLTEVTGGWSGKEFLVGRSIKRVCDSRLARAAMVGLLNQSRVEALLAGVESSPPEPASARVLLFCYLAAFEKIDAARARAETLPAPLRELLLDVALPDY